MNCTARTQEIALKCQVLKMMGASKDWEVFVRQKLSMGQVRNLEQLDDQHKDITERDVLVLKLLAAELSTRQAAQYLEIKPDSLKKAKHRLRKKLGLSAQTSWIQFLNQLEEND